jgi:hypothetical protein
MRPGATSGPLGRPRDREGRDVDALAWRVHELESFPEPRDALTLGLYWLTPDQFGITRAELSEVATLLSQPGTALAFMRRHFEGRYGFHWAEERDVVATADRMGRRIAVSDHSEYVVVPVPDRGMLVVVATFERRAVFEREEVWPRILASIRVGDPRGARAAEPRP